MRTNHKNICEVNTLIPEGEYEVIIHRARETRAQGRSPRVSISFIIRNDVEQPCRDRCVVESLWLTERALPYTEQKINLIDCLLNMSEHDYVDYNAWGWAAVGRPLRIQLAHERREGRDACERVRGYMGTRCPDVRHAYRPRERGDAAGVGRAWGGAPVGVPDDDALPF